MSDNQWLERRGLTWFAVKAVPRKLWQQVGKRRFFQSLQTHDVHIARTRRHAALAAFDAQLRATLANPSKDPMVQAGMGWRATFQALDRGDRATVARYRASYGQAIDPGTGDFTTNPTAIARELAADSFYEEIDRIRFTEGNLKGANTLAAIAQGHATPVLHYVNAWIAEGGKRGPVNPRTAHQYRRDVGEFVEWLATEGLPGTLEAVTAQAVGRYAGHLVAAGTHRTTANRKMVGPSGYWRWLVKRSHCPASPWVGQSLSKARRPGEAKPKRPYTEVEMRLLLGPQADPELADVIRIGALSGMRIEEIYRLRTGDCANGWFDIKAAKTAVGVRRVPIHTDLVEIIARRVKQRAKLSRFRG